MLVLLVGAVAVLATALCECVCWWCCRWCGDDGAVLADVAGAIYVRTAFAAMYFNVKKQNTSVRTYILQYTPALVCCLPGGAKCS